MVAIDTLEIVVKLKDLATGAFGAVTAKTTVMAKKMGESFRGLQKEVKANQVAFAALSAGATYMFMKIASNSALSSAVMSQFLAVLSYFSDLVMMTLMPAIQPLLDILWDFTKWYADAPEGLQLVIAAVTALGFAFSVLAFIVGPIGTMIKISLAVGGAAIKGMIWLWGLLSDTVAAIVTPNIIKALAAMKAAILANQSALITMGAAAVAAFAIYMAFTSKSPAMKAAFSALAGIMIVLAARTWVAAAAAMVHMSALTLGIAIAAIVAASVFGLAMLYGAKSKAETATTPAMAAGGIVTKPTVALIGEAGPEAVIPLGKGMGGVTINYDLKGAYILDQNRFQQILKQNADSIATELYRRGVISRPI